MDENAGLTTLQNERGQSNSVSSSEFHLSSSPTATDFSYHDNETIEYWEMSEAAYFTNLVVLITESVFGVFTNLLLIATICHSPSLNTPPNAHLVNICTTNLILSLSVILALSSLIVSNNNPESNCLTIFGHLQLFLSVICFLQYCAIFAAIGQYRFKTVKRPTLSLKERTGMIMRSIVLGWLFSSTAALFLCLAFRHNLSAMNWNPFRRYIDHSELDSLNANYKSKQKALLYIILLFILICVAIIIKSYYYILKTLYNAKPVGKNRVLPQQRSLSESTDGNDLFYNPSRTYKPQQSSITDTTNTAQSNTTTNVAGLSGKLVTNPFIISDGNTCERFVVHYQKRSHSLSVDEVFALENPLKAQAILYEKRAAANMRHPKLSTGSQATNTPNSLSNGIEFSDISPRAELQRFQHMKNKCALRNQSLKSERINLGSATRNSMIMVTIFMICSLPGFFCSIPGILSADMGTGPFTNTLLYCQLLFYLNIPAYPIWYLIFSKRVRKCVLKVYDTVLIKLHFRR